MDKEDKAMVIVFGMIFFVLLSLVVGYAYFNHVGMQACVAEGFQWVDGNCVRP